MELKQFITETLNQIIGGVKDAQKTAIEMGGRVNPTSAVNGRLKTILPQF